MVPAVAYYCRDLLSVECLQRLAWQSAVQMSLVGSHWVDSHMSHAVVCMLLLSRQMHMVHDCPCHQTFVLHDGRSVQHLHFRRQEPASH